MMRAWHPLLLLLGIVFLASVSVSFGITQKQQCLQSCKSEQDPYKLQQCKIRCRFVPEHEEQQEEREHQQPHEERGQRERGRQEGEKAEKEQDKREQPRPFPCPHQKEHEHEEDHKQPRGNPEECEGSDESESQKQNNPYHFSSNSFHTLFKNQYGHIRLLQRFNQRSPQLQNLLDYRVLEFKFYPNALFLPHHADSEFLLVVISGRALLTLVNNDARDSYNLQPGDALRIPAGTTYYLVNPHDNETLRVVTLAIPVNKPGRFESFFLSSTQDQQSYLQGFSKNILEASFKTELEEINRVLLGEEGQQGGEQRLQERVIVKLSKEQIQELGRHAKSSSMKTISSKDEPFNLRSGKPIYSNKFGKFHEITPEKNPQLRKLDIFLSFVDINEGALLLPHFNSKAIVILVINEGEANIELVGLKEQQQKKQQEEQPLEVRRYRAKLSEDDIFVIPAAYPFVVNATSNLNFLAFGINAENNQRNFLAGSKDNVISQIHRQVQELAFPGSGQDVEKLIKNQRESYFVDAQPQQKEEGRKGSLSSILGAFY